MARIEKTVFISYRRTNIPWAVAIQQNLTHNGYDVFFDYDGIASGDFESVIIENIRARAHFLVVLTPSALERCDDPGDWLCREIETALDTKRNIVPLMLEGFAFGAPAIAKHLTDKISAAFNNRGNARQARGDLEGALKAYQKYLDLGGGIRDGDQAKVEEMIRDLKKKL